MGSRALNALTITIGGTNDLPTIDASTNPLDIAEQLGDSSAQDIAPTTGTITFTDQDLGDSISFSVTGDATAAYTPDGNPQPDQTSPSRPPLSSINSSRQTPSPSTRLSPPMADNKPSTGPSIRKPLISIG